MKTTEVKTSELIGVALDWAVAYHLNGKPVFFDAFGARMLGRSITDEVKNGNIKPSTDWSQGGTLIEKYAMSVVRTEDHWFACDVSKQRWIDTTQYDEDFLADTPLIAAMRAIVAAKLGDVVSVPVELVERAK